MFLQVCFGSNAQLLTRHSLCRARTQHLETSATGFRQRRIVHVGVRFRGALDSPRPRPERTRQRTKRVGESVTGRFTPGESEGGPKTRAQVAPAESSRINVMHASVARTGTFPQRDSEAKSQLMAGKKKEEQL